MLRGVPLRAKFLKFMPYEPVPMLVICAGTSAYVQELGVALPVPPVTLLYPKGLFWSHTRGTSNSESTFTVSEMMLKPVLLKISAMPLPVESRLSVQIASVTKHWVCVKDPLLPVGPNPIDGSTPLALATFPTERRNRATARKLRIWINRLIFDPRRRDLLHKSLHISRQKLE